MSPFPCPVGNTCTYSPTPIAGNYYRCTGTQDICQTKTRMISPILLVKTMWMWFSYCIGGTSAKIVGHIVKMNKQCWEHCRLKVNNSTWCGMAWCHVTSQGSAPSKEMRSFRIVLGTKRSKDVFHGVRHYTGNLLSVKIHWGHAFIINAEFHTKCLVCTCTSSFYQCT